MTFGHGSLDTLVPKFLPYALVRTKDLPSRIRNGPPLWQGQNPFPPNATTKIVPVKGNFFFVFPLPISIPRLYSGMRKQTTPELEAIVGGLSKPSKMPGWAYGIPAQACKVGSLLRTVKGSTCSKCYALKGMYVFPNVRAAQSRRMESLSSPVWILAMTELISRRTKKVPFFRWHDSGDIQNVDHLEKIVQIAKNLPRVSFWLPTREVAIVKEWLRENPSGFPINLVVRISAPMIGRTPEKIPGTVGSSVEDSSGFQCPAPTQGNACGDCRACWSPKVENVSYHAH